MSTRRNHNTFIKRMVSNGGPRISEYVPFANWLDEVAIDYQNGQLNHSQLQTLRNIFGQALSTQTMQGFVYRKPHGYAGDYEIIDKIYRQHVTTNPHLKNWDKYFHAQSAPIAVRNRKGYFIRLLKSLDCSVQNGYPIRVLNVASGPGRDLFEFFNGGGNTKIEFDCIEYDQNAINYALSLCSDFASRVKFIKENVLKFKTQKRYPLIWSAGLFDYFDDKAFVALLQRFFSFLSYGGELVIGNFSEKNPTRNYMEIIGEWHLHHRSSEKLISLAKESGIPRQDIQVSREVEGVNLFLHVKRGKEFMSF